MINFVLRKVTFALLICPLWALGAKAQTLADSYKQAVQDFKPRFAALQSSVVANKPASGRRFACHFQYKTDGYQSFNPGKAITIDEDSVMKKIQDLMGQKKKAAVPVELNDENTYLSIKFEALVGPACSVSPAPGCRSWNDGPLMNVVTISVTEKATKQTVEIASENLNSPKIASRFGIVSFTPTGSPKATDGQPIRKFGVQCEDVAY